MKTLFPVIRLAISAGILMSAPFASAQNSSFLFVPGVAGESFDDMHKDWIDLVSFGQSLEPQRRGTLCDASVNKLVDSASPALWSAVASGVVFPEMRVETVQAGVRVLDHRLRNVRVLRVKFGEDPLQPTAKSSSCGHSLW